jgi:hypothetical protein
VIWGFGSVVGPVVGPVLETPQGARRPRMTN